MDGKAFARSRQAVRRERVALIRGRVCALSLVLFFAVWVVIGTQLALGHDPALTAKARMRHRLAVAQRRNARAHQRALRNQALNLNSVQPAPPPPQNPPDSAASAPPASDPNASQQAPSDPTAVQPTAPAPPPAPAPAPVTTSQS